MNIQINNNNGYSFVLGKFDSKKQYFLIPGIKSSYKYAWQAEKDARGILKKRQYLTAEETDAYESIEFQNASAEDMMLDHYKGALKSIRERANGVDKSDTDERKMIYEEIKLIVKGLLTIKDQITEDKEKSRINGVINEFSHITKEHFNDLLSNDKNESHENLSARNPSKFIKAAMSGKELQLNHNELCEVMEDYACRVCEAIQDKIPDAVYVLYPENKNIDIVSANSKKKHIRVSINSNYLVGEILPYSDLPKVSSLEFYQLYLKPIFQAVGHIVLSGKLLVHGKSTLPDVKLNKESVASVDGWDIKNKKLIAMQIDFGGQNRTWKMAQSKNNSAKPNSKYTEQDYIGENGAAIVQCIDSQLESIFNKKGIVVQLIPMADHVEMDVDFGNHIVRLTEKQIQIMHEV